MDSYSLEKLYGMVSKINSKVRYHSVQHGSGFGVVKANPGGGLVYVEKVNAPPKKESQVVPFSEDNRSGFFIRVKDLQLCNEDDNVNTNEEE